MKKHLFPFIAAFLMLLGASSALVSCKDATADALRANQALTDKYKAIDDSVIRAYLTRHHYVAGSGPGTYTRTNEGLYLVPIVSHPEGATPTSGKLIGVKYIGRFISLAQEDVIFDSSIDGKSLCNCFSFVMGTSPLSVIAGWDTGVKLIHKGEKKLLFVPSYMAYGITGHGLIGSNTPLLFEMEVVGISE